jgi:hypothetical protein
MKMGTLVNPPRKSLEERMRNALSTEEWNTLIDYIEAVREDGFGGVSVEIENHHPAKINITGRISKLLTKIKQKSYRPE